MKIMSRTTKTYSVSFPFPVAEALARVSSDNGTSPGLYIAELVEKALIENEHSGLSEEVRTELELLHWLRDEAMLKKDAIVERDGHIPDITLKTFQACYADANWRDRYEKYIGGDAVTTRNSRKTNANQTIGSRIKSSLGAEDVLNDAGKPERGKAPNGSIIQTYQILTY